MSAICEYFGARGWRVPPAMNQDQTEWAYQRVCDGFRLMQIADALDVDTRTVSRMLDRCCAWRPARYRELIYRPGTAYFDIDELIERNIELEPLDGCCPVCGEKLNVGRRVKRRHFCEVCGQRVKFLDE